MTDDPQPGASFGVQDGTVYPSAPVTSPIATSSAAALTECQAASHGRLRLGASNREGG